MLRSTTKNSHDTTGCQNVHSYNILSPKISHTTEKIECYAKVSNPSESHHHFLVYNGVGVSGL